MTAEASSKQARAEAQHASARPEPAISPAVREETALLPKPQASQWQKLQELPFRSADGRWTCTYSTGGLNKDRWVVRYIPALCKAWYCCFGSHQVGHLRRCEFKCIRLPAYASPA